MTDFRRRTTMPAMVSRRAVLSAPLVLLASRATSAASRTMTLAAHQNTSAAAGFRRSLEGWSRAGIQQVELIAPLLDEFLKTDSLPAARRMLVDLGLTPVSCNCGTLQGVWEPNSNRAASVDAFTRRCELFANLGVPRIYTTTATTQTFSLDDYKRGAENMRQIGDVARQFAMIAMAEFVRTSSFIATLPTLLNMTRAAAHPNLRPMLDCYHFWSGLNKLEDLDLLRPGELEHVHFQDVPDLPRELLNYTTRVLPGDGVSPLVTILKTLAAKDYRGSLSVEVFLPKYQAGDQFEVGKEIRAKAEAIMRQAHVLGRPTR
jgi:2-keto-myo-inositol isomerase